MKAQVLADFVIECTIPDEEVEEMRSDKTLEEMLTLSILVPTHR